MKSKLICLIVVSCLPFVANNTHAATLSADLYGELDVSRDFVQSASDAWISNVTKIGVKGSYPASDSLSVVYQFEEEVDVLHGGTSVDSLFALRNTFIGLEGGFGRVLFGAHDTPLKRTQGKVDLFNDQLGDIKALLPGEVRARDSFAWNSPKWGGVSLQAMYVPSDRDFGASESIAITFEDGDLYASLALDSDMRKNERAVAKTNVYDTVRGAVQYTPGDWKLGLIIQDSRQVNKALASHQQGYIVSVSRAIASFTLQAQWGQSDILAADATQLLLGARYNFDKKSNIYLILSKFDQGGSAVNAVSIGTEWKF